MSSTAFTIAIALGPKRMVPELRLFENVSVAHSAWGYGFGRATHEIQLSAWDGLRDISSCRSSRLGRSVCS